MHEQENNAKKIEPTATGMYHTGKASEETPTERIPRTPGEVVLEALRKAGAIKNWQSLSPDHLTLISDLNQASDLLKSSDSEDSSK